MSGPKSFRCASFSREMSIEGCIPDKTDSAVSQNRFKFVGGGSSSAASGVNNLAICYLAALFKNVDKLEMCGLGADGAFGGGG